MTSGAWRERYAGRPVTVMPGTQHNTWEYTEPQALSFMVQRHLTFYILLYHECIGATKVAGMPTIILYFMTSNAVSSWNITRMSTHRIIKR